MMTTDEYADWLRTAKYFTTEDIIREFLKVDRISAKIYDQSIRECRSEISKFLRRNIPKAATISTEELRDAIKTHEELRALLPEIEKKRAVVSNYRLFLKVAVLSDRLHGHQIRMNVEFIRNSELKRTKKRCDNAVEKLRPEWRALRKARAREAA